MRHVLLVPQLKSKISHACCTVWSRYEITCSIFMLIWRSSHMIQAQKIFFAQAYRRHGSAKWFSLNFTQLLWTQHYTGGTWSEDDEWEPNVQDCRCYVKDRKTADFCSSSSYHHWYHLFLYKNRFFQVSTKVKWSQGVLDNSDGI